MDYAPIVLRCTELSVGWCEWQATWRQAEHSLSFRRHYHTYTMVATHGECPLNYDTLSSRSTVQTASLINISLTSCYCTHCCWRCCHGVSLP